VSFPAARSWLLVFALFLSGPVVAIDTDARLSDPARQEMYDRLTHEVRCLVCQNQTIGDSSAPLAADLRREIRRMVEEGQSEEEIKVFLLDRYGDFVLYKPRFKSSTAVLWLAPALLLLVGGIVLARVLRRRATLPVPDDDGAPGESVKG
jgi:cytochrome c-type biogenesis protein CcmH